MSSNPDHDRNDDSGGFGLELDEDLLAEAMAAVDRSTRRSRTATDEAAEVAEAEDALDTELGDDFDFEVELDTSAPETDEHDGRAELDALSESHKAAVAQLRQLEERTVDLEQSLDQAGKERRRLLGALRRTEEQVARELQKVDREREMRRGAEDQIAALRRQVEGLQRDLDQLRERRRRERDDERQHGHSRTVSAFLPVLDNLELALSHRNDAPERVVHGVSMIVQQFHQSLTTLGVQRVVAGSGVLFDPELHEAISEVRTDELLPGSIVEELRPGYLINGRLLRASRVTVAMMPPSQETPASPEPTAATEAATSDDSQALPHSEAAVPSTSPSLDLAEDDGGLAIIEPTSDDERQDD